MELLQALSKFHFSEIMGVMRGSMVENKERILARW
jgi:hypothetical protein